MSIRNQNWYNLQSTRRYPLDENSTGLDDSNNFIRDDILVDCHIRFPSTYGKYVYVQGLTVSAGIVTVVFGVSATDGFVTGEPLAVVSIPKPVISNINYTVTALKPGVSGWVVFGPGVEDNFVGRYTSVQQTLVAPRCARSYRPLPVPTIGKIGLATALQGVVNLIGDLPVRVRYDATAGRVVNVVDGGKTTARDNVQALVIELDPAQITENYNPLQLFLGPCAQRPESGTCPKTPIESINGIAPDCNGNIEFVFENFHSAESFLDCGGVDIISGNDLKVICDASDETRKKRPKIYQDECCVAGYEVDTESELFTFPAEQRTAKMIIKTLNTGERWQLGDDLLTWTATSSSEFCSWPDPTTAIPDIVIDELASDPAYSSVTLPACVDFSNCDGATQFTTRVGTFSVVSQASPAACSSCVSSELDADSLNSSNNSLTTKSVYVTENTSALSIATFNNAATDWATGKTISAELKIATAGPERNGGVLLNYRRYLNEFGQTQTTFAAVVVDAARGQLRVLRYTNNSITVEGIAALTVKTGSWYRVSVTPVLDGTNVVLNVYAEEMTTTNKATATMVVQIDATMYGELTGYTGLFANRSYTYFNRFTIVG
jgi:hypothetical protein